MTDPSNTAPPVAPSEARPTKPPQEQIDEFLTGLEARAKDEMWHKMAAQVPPVMYEDFIAKFPAPAAVTVPPVDENDIRQAESKRGEAAPGEPTEYVDATGKTIDPKVLPEPAA